MSRSDKIWLAIIGMISLAFLLPILAALINYAAFERNPKFGDWISDDGTLVISDERAKLYTEDDEIEFVVKWDDGSFGTPRFRLPTEDYHNLMDVPSTYNRDSFFVEWKYRYFFKNTFRMTVDESDIWEGKKVYTFHKLDEETKETHFPVTVTDTPELTGSALYHRGEHDSNITWENALPQLFEKGYVLEEKTQWKPLNLRRKNGNEYDFMEIVTYDSPEKASLMFDSHLDSSVAKGCIMRINESIFTTSQGAARDLAEIFGFSLPREYATVDKTVLFQTKYTLIPDFEKRLNDEGYRTCRPAMSFRRDEILYCTAPDGAYTFSIVNVYKKAETIDEFLRQNAYPTVQGVVFIECRKENGTRLLAIPYEAAETVLAIITEEN